jgi:hypothetical protein
MSAEPWRSTDAELDARVAHMLARDSLNLGQSSDQDRLMLMLTRSCELRCSYCFVGLTEDGRGQDHPGAADPATLAAPPGQPVGDMSAATLQRAVDWLMRSERERLGLQFFGGEPTRRFTHVRAAMRYALQHPQRARRPLEFLLTTNGLSLNAARLGALDGLPLTVQFSLDGDAAGSRFRRGHVASAEVVGEATERAIDALQQSGLSWFMNATLPPAAAEEVEARYAWARARGVPALQLNYATGMDWRPEQQASYLRGLWAVLADHRARPEGLRLLNWANGADPAPLCGDMIVDVDGGVYQVGALFHERRSPALKASYRIGHLDGLQAGRFTDRRWRLSALADRTRQALSGRPLEIFFDNVRLGAAVDLLVERARALGAPA